MMTDNNKALKLKKLDLDAEYRIVCLNVKNMLAVVSVVDVKQITKVWNKSE